MKNDPLDFAIEQALAVLPDAAFAEKFGIRPSFIHELEHVISHWSAEGDNPFSGLSQEALTKKKCELLLACNAVMVARACPNGGDPAEVVVLIDSALRSSGVDLDGVLAFDIDWDATDNSTGEDYDSAWALSHVMLIPRRFLQEYCDANEELDSDKLLEFANDYGADYLSEKSSFLVNGFSTVFYALPATEASSHLSL